MIIIKTWQKKSGFFARRTKAELIYKVNSKKNFWMVESLMVTLHINNVFLTKNSLWSAHVKQIHYDDGWHDYQNYNLII